MSFLEYVDRAAELAKQGLTVELQEVAMELRQQGVQLQQENVNLKLEMLDLKEKLHNLQEALKIKGNLRWESPVYWLIIEDGTKDGPYCQRCWDVENQLVRIHRIDYGWQCHQCTVNRGTGFYKNP